MIILTILLLTLILTLIYVMFFVEEENLDHIIISDEYELLYSDLTETYVCRKVGKYSTLYLGRDTESDSGYCFTTMFQYALEKKNKEDLIYCLRVYLKYEQNQDKKKESYKI